jgi:hypothetical protein
MRFAMLITNAPDDWAEDRKNRTPETMQEIIDWFTTWGEAGKLGEGGVDLASPVKARTIRSRGGAPVVTDGPYLELKEVVGGVVLLEVADLDEAVKIGSTWPGLRTWGSSVEIRPIIEH